jgi:hypothetical protein
MLKDFHPRTRACEKWRFEYYESIAMPNRSETIGQQASYAAIQALQHVLDKIFNIAHQRLSTRVEEGFYTRQGAIRARYPLTPGDI